MSDENNDSSSEAEPAASEQAPETADTVSKAEFDRVVAQRQQLKAKLRELEQASATTPEAPAVSPMDDAPEWAKALQTQVLELKQLRETDAKTSRRDQALKGILEGVPEAQHEHAKLIVAGLEAGGLDITTTEAAAEAAAKLQTFQSVFHDPARGRPRGSVQRGPDGKLNTSGLTLDDITPEIAREAFADPEFRARAVPGAAVGVDHGYNI